MTLKELEIGKTAVVTVVGGEGSLRQHFLDMGVLPGTEVTLVKYAPMGDPMELWLHGYELTLRLEDAARIEIDEESILEARAAQETEGSRARKRTREHPGLGEGGRYHVKADENPLPKDAVLAFALAGN